MRGEVTKLLGTRSGSSRYSGPNRHHHAPPTSQESPLLHSTTTGPCSSPGQLNEGQPEALSSAVLDVLHAAAEVFLARPQPSTHARFELGGVVHQPAGTLHIRVLSPLHRNFSSLASWINTLDAPPFRAAGAGLRLYPFSASVARSLSCVRTKTHTHTHGTHTRKSTRRKVKEGRLHCTDRPSSHLLSS